MAEKRNIDQFMKKKRFFYNLLCRISLLLLQFVGLIHELEPKSMHKVHYLHQQILKKKIQNTILLLA